MIQNLYRQPTKEELAHLRDLTRNWQVVGDLAFSDLSILIPDDDGWVVWHHTRPHTAPTVHMTDIVGSRRHEPIPAPMEPTSLPTFYRDNILIVRRAVPITLDSDPFAMLLVERMIAEPLRHSSLEDLYTVAVRRFETMIFEGTFPYRQEEKVSTHHAKPRVGEGVILLDKNMRVTYVSPNAVSVYRRLAPQRPLMGKNFSKVDIEPNMVISAMETMCPARGEITGNRSTVVRSVMPFIKDNESVGALVLVRDVTEIQRHEEEIRARDLTISEVHHRVKNNLQTVAALLRLQARRSDSYELQSALAESVRRISSIAAVHELLSAGSFDGVDFIDVAKRIITSLGQGLIEKGTNIQIDVAGSTGILSSNYAAPLALILSELVQNSIEHAFVGEFKKFSRDPKVLVEFACHNDTGFKMIVKDNGVGLGAENLQSRANLGLQICETIVSSELGGRFQYQDLNEGCEFRVIIDKPTDILS